MFTKSMLVAGLALVVEGLAAQEVSRDNKLVMRIDSLAEADQKARGVFRELRNQPDPDPGLLDAASAEVLRVDSLNHLELVQIVNKYGFPDTDIVGKESTHHFWLLVQHQDAHPDFQQTVLEKMSSAVKLGKADGQDFAYLVDRVRVNTGQLQLYGTQMRVNADKSSFEPSPCEDPEQLDARRASVHLMPMVQYIEIMNQTFHGQLKR